ncbi:MAG: hypothetical protein O7C75_18190 [Verrucomicrobia bacterium]|nr:hypothetical protein [Verrucomicrobiota bacterium]
MSSEESPDLSTAIKLLANAIIGALIGCFIAAAYLVTTPVMEVTFLPDQIEPAMHYVLKGRTAGGDSWKYKATELQGGKSEVTFLETDMNRWASSFSTDYPEEKPSIYLEPQRPIFRLEGDKLLISAAAETGFGAWHKLVILSLEGDFVPDAGALQVEPDKFYIGSLRLPGPVKDFVWKRISRAYILDDEFQSLWSSIESANIHESQLILTAK